MQFSYSLTRDESNTQIKIPTVTAIFGKDVRLTTGTTVQYICANILAQIEAITATWRTEFSRTFSNEKANYMTGLFDTSSGSAISKYNYTMVFYDATNWEYYSIMETDVDIADFVSHAINKLTLEYGLTQLGVGDHNVFLKSCILEVE